MKRLSSTGFAFIASVVLLESYSLVRLSLMLKIAAESSLDIGRNICCSFPTKEGEKEEEKYALRE